MNRFRIVSDGEFYYVEEAIISTFDENSIIGQLWKRLKKIKWKNAVVHNEHLTEEQAVAFISKVLRKREGLKVIKEL